MAAAWPGAYDLGPLDAIRSIRQFDETYTAPHHGFAGASDYYHRASALRLASAISVPALVLSAADDPFVPEAQFDDPALRQNALVTVRIERHGGHCGFVAPARAAFDGYWAEETALDFLARALS
jgi:predicted alpha/beta-fold hydrolase